MKTHDSQTTRNGKIARLPREIRQELNERLADGEPSQRLVKWLNSLPEVQECLEDLFDGRPINEPNLTAWKQGGFRDWERHEESRVWVREVLDEADELTEEIEETFDGASLLDRITDRLAVALLQLFRAAEISEPGPTRTRTMLEIARELDRLRKSDHRRQRTAIQQKRWGLEENLAAKKLGEEQAREEHQKAALEEIYAEGYRAEYIRGKVSGQLEASQEEWIRQYFARHEEDFRKRGIRGLPQDEDLLAAAEELERSTRQREKVVPGPEKIVRRGKVPEAKKKQPSQGGLSPLKPNQGEKLFREEVLSAN